MAQSRPNHSCRLFSFSSRAWAFIPSCLLIVFTLLLPACQEDEFFYEPALESGYSGRPPFAVVNPAVGGLRATGFWGNLAQEVDNEIFEGADALWSSFQEKLTAEVKRRGGQASYSSSDSGPNIKKGGPDWEKVKDYLLKGEGSLEDIGCN